VTPTPQVLLDGAGPVEPLPSAGIRGRGLTRRFGKVAAVQEMDLDAPYGEVTGLVGPNGAGKTTLLLMLATLLRPDVGELLVAGHDPRSDPAAVRRHLGWAPDTFGLHGTDTAREHLAFMAAAHRLPKPDIPARVSGLLARLQLDPLADRAVHTLSRGQKQWLGLAAALVHEPRVLLLDEPAAGLDPGARVRLREVLRSLAAEGTCVLISSHVLTDLEEVADSVVVVDKGRTVAAHRLTALPAIRDRRWRIRSLDEARLQRVLTELRTPHTPGMAGIDVSLTDDAAAAGLLQALVGAGVPIVAFAPVVGALEAAYMADVEDSL
jgi:ABC-2 type transport system ATP-binding protein